MAIISSSDSTKGAETSKLSSIGSLYFFCVGMGIQVCWSSIINSFDYFGDYYKSPKVDFTFPIAVYLAQFIVTVLMTKISHHFRFTTRILVPFLIASIILAFLPFQPRIFDGSGFGYFFILGILFIMGFCSNIIYSSMIGVSSHLPGKYTTYFLIGSGASSMVLSILRLLMKAIFPGQKGLAVTVFFIVSAMFIVTAIMLHMTFMKSGFYKSQLHGEEDESMSDEEQSLTRTKSASKRDPETVKRVFKKIYIYPLLIGLTFVQMFTVFPGVAFKKDMGEMSTDTKITTLNFTFSIAFIIGKMLGKYRNYYNKNMIFAVVMFRFIICACMVLQVTHKDIPVLGSRWFGYVNIAIFGLTTGLANCALFILGPESLPKEEKEVSGYVSVFGLATGTVIGTFLALIFKDI